MGRVAVVYGQGSYERSNYHGDGTQASSVNYSRGAANHNAGSNYNQSPYLVSMVGGSDGGKQNNAVGIIRRSKNYLDEVKNRNSGYQVRLPNI